MNHRFLSRTLRPALVAATLAASCALPVAAQTTGGSPPATSTGTTTTTGDAGRSTGSDDRNWGWLGLLGLVGLLGLRRRSDMGGTTTGGR